MVRDRIARRMLSGRMLVIAVVLGLVSAPCASANAQQSSSKAKITAAKVLENYVKVTGGQKAYDKINNRVVKGTMELPAMGVKLELTMYAAKPNKVHSIAQSEQLGAMEEGTDGVTAWEKSMMTGPRVLDSAEAADALREAVFDKYTYWRKNYDKVELAGEDSVGGKMCYKIIATPKEGTPQTLYFDQASSFLVKVEFVYRHQMGALPIEARLSDYRQVDRILIPHRMVTKMVGQERVDVLTSVQHNVELPPDIFALPADVQALIKKE